MRIEVPDSELMQMADTIYRNFKTAQPLVEEAMAIAYKDVVIANFGDFELDRPTAWAPLSKRYAKKVNRNHATLMVSMKLMGAVKQVDNVVSVSDSDVPYATVHQFGGGNNIPARPYFPFDTNGKATEFTQNYMQAVAKNALNDLIQ